MIISKFTMINGDRKNVLGDLFIVTTFLYFSLSEEYFVSGRYYGLKHKINAYMSIILKFKNIYFPNMYTLNI